MLTVLMECRDQESELAQTLSVLVPAAVEGLVSDVIVLDHGSRDGSSRVADAAGCRFHTGWDIGDIVRSARGDWLLLIEAGARPQSGWIDEVMEYVALGKLPARFAASRTHKKPFLKRVGRGRPPLECGLLLPKHQASVVARAGMDLATLATVRKPVKLASQIVPAWVAALNR